MKPTDERHQGACQDTEWSELPNSTINHLPDEILLEIFDSYRQGVDSYDHQWREKYVWFNLTHVSRKWRTVIFASSSRLDLGITVGPEKPSHFRTILSGPLPIFIDYKSMYEEVAGCALWRMRAALERHDRVRQISVEGMNSWLNEVLSATNCAFPILESVVLRSKYGEELKLPDTFLGGANLSHSYLRRLELERFSLTFISGFLLSASALTDLFLKADTVFSTSPETSLLACLQGMTCLFRLDLSISSTSPLSFPPPPSDVVPLSKLTCFRYIGHSVFLDALVAGFSAPFLRDLSMEFFDEISSPFLHLPRFINETKEHYHAVNVTFHEEAFRLSLLTQSECFSHQKPVPRLSRIPIRSPESIIRMSGALSAKFTTVDKLCVTFGSAMMVSEDYILWRRFYQQFPGVEVLRTEGINHWVIGYTLLQDHEEPDDALAFFPALEEIELGETAFWNPQRRSEYELEYFRPFVSARQQAGRPVRAFFRP